MAFSIKDPLKQPIKPALIRLPAFTSVEPALSQYLTFIYLIIIFLLIITDSCSELCLLCLHHLLLYHYLLVYWKAHEIFRGHAFWQHCWVKSTHLILFIFINCVLLHFQLFTLLLLVHLYFKH